MIIIEERRANKMPCYTALYFKKVCLTSKMYEAIEQQELYNFDEKNQEIEMPITKLYYLVNMLSKIDDVKFIPFVEKEIKNIKLDNSDFKIKPLSHQITAVEYGLSRNGWILRDDMGLGKTASMIYLAETLKKEKGIEHCLIVCAVNSLKYNWESEIKEFSNLSCTILGQTITKRGNSVICSVADRCKILKEKIDEFFIITNIETLQSDEFIKAYRKSKNKFGMIVLDEAHKLKNPSTASAKTLIKMNSEHNIALTGSLIVNSPENAYVALKWTGNTNSSCGRFEKMYNVYGGFGNTQVVGHKNLDLLRELIEKCSLRRLKEEVLDLPEKNYKIEYVEMTPKQEKLYREVENGIMEELELLPYKNKLSMAQEMVLNMRLRQITAYPGILSETVKESAKIDRLEELLEQIYLQGDKAIVFCTFKSTAKEIYKRIEKYNPLLCTGDNSDKEINDAKDKFQHNEENKVLVATWQKIGTGLTLTKANYVIFIDTPWTPSDFKQACDRINRIGQHKEMFFITLIAKNTYDERVQQILDRKELTSDYVEDNVDNELFKQYSDYDF